VFAKQSLSNARRCLNGGTPRLRSSSSGEARRSFAKAAAPRQAARLRGPLRPAPLAATSEKLLAGLRSTALSAACQRTGVLRFRDGGRSRLPAHATDDKTPRRPATLALGWGPNASTKDDKPKRRFVGLPSAAAARNPSALVGRHRRPRCGPSAWGRRAIFPGVATGIAARMPSAQTDALPSTHSFSTHSFLTQDGTRSRILRGSDRRSS